MLIIFILLTCWKLWQISNWVGINEVQFLSRAVCVLRWSLGVMHHTQQLKSWCQTLVNQFTMNSRQMLMWQHGIQALSTRTSIWIHHQASWPSLPNLLSLISLHNLVEREEHEVHFRTAWHQMHQHGSLDLPLPHDLEGTMMTYCRKELKRTRKGFELILLLFKNCEIAKLVEIKPTRNHLSFVKTTW